MADTTLPIDVLGKAGVPVAQATQDDVSLLYLQDPKQTNVAVSALQDFQKNGTIPAYQQGTQVNVEASEVIDKILAGPSLVAAGFGDPSKDSTTPNIIVTLKPGFIWVGNPQEFHLQAGRARGVRSRMIRMSR